MLDRKFELRDEEHADRNWKSNAAEIRNDRQRTREHSERDCIRHSADLPTDRKAHRHTHTDDDAPAHESGDRAIHIRDNTEDDFLLFVGHKLFNECDHARK